MPASVSHLHKLVARNHKLLKAAWSQATHLLQSRLPFALRLGRGALQPIYIPVNSQPVHPSALLRRRGGDARNYSTKPRIDRSSFPSSRTATAVSALTGRAPFASTLRPNLTGGTLGRTAGGYALGSGRIGGARYFSHGPAAPAEVIQNVSQALRAFCMGGKKAQYNGVNPRGEKRYRSVTTLQDTATRKVNAIPKATPGSYVDFAVNPTITALTPLANVAGFSHSNSEEVRPSLNSEGLLDVLSVDFSRALRDLAAVLSDLQKLSALGDLPITYRDANTLRVHFPGCDADSIERICQELDIKRGIVSQDEDFDVFAGTEIALLFPFAPSQTSSERAYHLHSKDRDAIDWKAMMPSEHYSTKSESSYDLFEPVPKSGYSDWSPEGYESLHSPSHGFDSSASADPLEYHDFEGIYRFIELCDGARR